MEGGEGWECRRTHPGPKKGCQKTAWKAEGEEYRGGKFLEKRIPLSKRHPAHARDKMAIRKNGHPRQPNAGNKGGKGKRAAQERLMPPAVPNLSPLLSGLNRRIPDCVAKEGGRQGRRKNHSPQRFGVGFSKKNPRKQRS